MYLKEDVIGAYSKKVYGVKGDKVAILINDKPCLLLHENSSKFHADYNLLSNQKINKIEVKNEKVTKSKKRI